MLVKEVLARAAGHVGRGELAEELASLASGAEPSEEAGSLLRCYQLVESEVALAYCPLRTAERVTPVGGKVQYLNFSHLPVDVHEVREGEKRLSFTMYASYLEVPGASGAVTVDYAYAPEESGFFDDVPFPARVSGEALSLGVCSEFLLTCGRYEEAAVWEGKFRAALKGVGVFRRKLCAIRSRRWV